MQTWAETKTSKEILADAGEALDEDEENADAEEGGDGEEPPKGEPLTEDIYNRRVPHPNYVAWKEVEKLCKQANSETLHTYVIFSGLLYGEGEDKLHSVFKQVCLTLYCIYL